MEYYLPLLENLVLHINLIDRNRRMISWISDLKIRWSSVLSSPSIFNPIGPKFYQFDNVYFELGMTLFVYGAMLREQALEVLPSGKVNFSIILGFQKDRGNRPFKENYLKVQYFFYKTASFGLRNPYHLTSPPRPISQLSPKFLYSLPGCNAFLILILLLQT